MPLSRQQKFRLSFNFTVENTQNTLIRDYFGNKENFGINTGVFENLENTVNLEELSEGDAKDLHTKLVWEKFELYEINDLEIMVKLYDLFFLFGEISVTESVRDVLRDMITPTPDFSNKSFGQKELRLINSLYDEGRNEVFLERIISNAKTKATQNATIKRIEKLPTI